MDPKLLTIRSKKIGVCLADTRLNTRKSVEESAEYLGITPQQYTAFEKGVTTPSLPQLESLAAFFNVPIEHLIKWRPDSESKPKFDAATLDKIVKLRDHVIAAYISKARKDKQLTSESLAASCGISEEDLLAYENAEKSIPYPVLEGLSKFLEIDLSSLHAAHGPLAQKTETAEMVETNQKIGDLPPEFVDFINKPINRPYLELAQKLSAMNVDRLRAIAESLLEITY